MGEKIILFEHYFKSFVTKCLKCKQGFDGFCYSFSQLYSFDLSCHYETSGYFSRKGIFQKNNTNSYVIKSLHNNIFFASLSYKKVFFTLNFE
jgi:hypothetical protein